MRTPALSGRSAPSRGNVMMRRYLLIAVLLIVLYVLVRAIFGHHETKYEAIARQMTVALQNNDLAGVEKFQNAETATLVTHAVVGRDADAFAPLGKLQKVRETAAPPEAVAHRIHLFDATFAKGVVHETIRFDPDDKVVGFKYDLPAGQ